MAGRVQLNVKAANVITMEWILGRVGLSARQYRATLAELSITKLRSLAAFDTDSRVQMANPLRAPGIATPVLEVMRFEDIFKLVAMQNLNWHGYIFGSFRSLDTIPL